jgi:AcrR family transcriptional regulator
MLHQIEALFATTARTPKGQRALRAIFAATRATVAQNGLKTASLDLIANRAGLTQAALRHYFPTRDDLLTAYFSTATDWLQGQMRELLSRDEISARDRLERCIGWHLEYMENVDTAFWLEASAFWLREKNGRHLRDDWYRWLTGQYAALIGQIQPAMNPRERERRAYAVLTLVLGAWITHGRGSAVDRKAGVVERRQLLIDVAMDIATQ